MASFLKDRLVMEEGHRVDDLLDFSSESSRLESYINDISQSSIIGYIGKFGSGKSTCIYQLIKKNSTDKTTKWFEFDAWKYPERRDLWEGFVLDIADQLGTRSKVQKAVDGKQTKSAVVDITTDIAGAGMELFGEIAERATGVIGKIAGKIQIADKLVDFFKRSPIKRVFEIQDLLNKMFTALEADTICIVIEDIDRSGDAGQYFLETMRQFIKNNTSGKKIIILVPIGLEVYDGNAEHYASYQKTLDYTIFFEPRGIVYSKYIDHIFDPNSFPTIFQTSPHLSDTPKWKEHLNDWFRIATDNNLTIREIKSIIRSADIVYSQLKELGFSPDPRVVLAIQILTSIKSEGYVRWIKRIGIDNDINGSFPTAIYLQTVALNITTEVFSKNYQSMRIRLVDTIDMPIPVKQMYTTREEDQGYTLSSYYLIPHGQKLSPKL